MTDRELLELAAKAAGFRISFPAHGCDEQYPPLRLDTWAEWDPLTDDGDALRLAAKLRLRIIPGKHIGDGCTVEAQRPGIASCTAFRDNDDAKQMREAIVHVAAEIGKAMP